MECRGRIGDGGFRDANSRFYYYIFLHKGNNMFKDGIASCLHFGLQTHATKRRHNTERTKIETMFSWSPIIVSTHI